MKLEQVRIKKGMTQTDLDEAARLTRGTTNDIERGKNKNPSWEIVKRISDVLNVPPEELFPVKTNAA